MTTDFFTGEPLLRLIATALVRLSRVREVQDPVYDRTVLRAYNQVVLECLRAGAEPPRSVPDLVRWSTRIPLAQWPISLPDSVTGDTRLLDPDTRTPTQQCVEWAVSDHDAAGELYENTIMYGVLDETRAANDPDAYVAFRRTIITRPVITARDLSRLCVDDRIGFLDGQIKSSYEPASPRYLRDGTYATCAGCGLLLLPLPNGGWRCELDRCSRHGLTVGERIQLDLRNGVHQVGRPLRTFITGPGLAETDLEEDLRGLGVDVRMWPNFDAYDLQIIFPDGRAWAIDVKDRANPALLARGAQAFSTFPQHDRAYLVVPDYRFSDREDYTRVFDHHLPAELTGRLSLLSHTALLDRVRAELRPIEPPTTRFEGDARA